MAKVKNIHKAETVDELILALRSFPGDMPLNRRMVACRLVPTKGETWDDVRGAVKVEEDDGTYDD